LAAASGANEFITKSNFGIVSVFNVNLEFAVGKYMFDKYNKFRVELASINSHTTATNGFLITVFGLPFCPQNAYGLTKNDTGQITIANYKRWTASYGQNAFISIGINQMNILPFYIYKQPMLTWGINMIDSFALGAGIAAGADVKMEYLFNIYGEE
jgi:hypothetical protein